MHPGSILVLLNQMELIGPIRNLIGEYLPVIGSPKEPPVIFAQLIRFLL